MSDHIQRIREDLNRERLRLLEDLSREARTPAYYRPRKEHPSAGRRRAEILRTENAAFYAARKATK
ncbi:hypothetical protein SEA_ROSIEPOSIE_96 [Arthrobacter phage RosiePosie]|uniref:Uncharacterized protein n=14 Tax=Klausavirus princesstrina TaxID=1984784 RepID=A0A286N4A9_9CAUD|nr:hypothetical protein FDI82_gp097 [Arthrobacter phage PrincessTrina]ANU79696.1 hypothetical protein SEA_CONBOY_94 [Arthrobacter phage Conboy]AOZ64647.1 hypothetical protein SEA_CHUBSTER_96 [Arthrobacter phage Chubster]AOZ64759.1 hypothetical protein SEA_CHOCOLAT_96 [Arthrobacter phage Chocolat]APC44778.1 hypothetical protein SEA_EDGARPOE_95 [Arthrobacter phage EdgarPoe]APC44890.1 hypothetical protein SEA_HUMPTYDUMPTY_96 [Arthrobacter phage HumptyDumpty]ASX98880.1 hypothetical protein SEA_KA